MCHNYGLPQAKISTISNAAGKNIDDFWRRKRKLRRVLAPRQNFRRFLALQANILNNYRADVAWRPLSGDRGASGHVAHVIHV
jgi:hypothetical protein